MSTKTTKATKPAPTRAARRTPEQIAKDDVAMTEKKLALANARLERLRSETRKADYEASALARLLVYQSSHPLLTQEALDLEGGLVNQLDERPCPTCGHGSLLPHCASAACEWRRCGRADCQTTVDFPNLRAITLTAGDSKNGPAWVRVNLYGDQTGETT